MTVTDHDRERLGRAIALAAKGHFQVEPNPVVGCVIEEDGRVVGEGWHLAYGGPHAEIEALARAGDAARGATVYVSLEPCSRRSKTGPCTDALRAAGVARVVYAATDPNEAGRGAAALREAGIEVEGPALETAGRPLLAHFLAHRAGVLPFTVLKWAMTLDGRIAPGPGQGGTISGGRSRAFVHDLRAHADAVAVGVETVLVDDPRLTCRLEDGPPHGRAQPLRVVFDSRLRTPLGSRLLAEAPDVPVLVVAAAATPARREALEQAGAEVVVWPDGQGRVDLRSTLEHLRRRGVHRLLVEGGARIHGALLRAGLADQVSAFVAPTILGASDAVPAVTGTGFTGLPEAVHLEATRWRRVGEDLLFEGFVPARSS